MILKTIPYNQYEPNLPQQGNHILGQLKDDSIFVYQAYKDAIANYAIAHQKFGGNAFSFERMTWIKPNFLWMMYRSGWAVKENQTRILAIEISLIGFSELLHNGVYSSYQPNVYGSEEKWKAALASSDVRIQWDPDHDPHGNKLNRRAVQIGIKGKDLEKFNNEYIRSITDITDFVNEQRLKLKDNFKDLIVIEEQVIKLNADLKKKYDL